MIGKPIYNFSHLDKVHWSDLTSNPNAIHILEQHLDKALVIREATKSFL
jgi:hypothetical protein